MTTADALCPAPSAGAVQFLGKEAAYWRLRIKGAALLMVTLGLYRFWFATDVRRFLWSNTEIGGETLEYTGLATELLGGFLLAIAILVPLYTALAAALALALDAAEQLTGVIGFLLLVLLGQFALYRARRYRLDAHGVSRRAFRSARLGVALRALMRWSGGASSSSRSGSLIRGRRRACERFKMRHTSYGDLPGAFEGFGIGVCSCAACRSGSGRRAHSLCFLGAGRHGRLGRAERRDGRRTANKPARSTARRQPARSRVIGIGVSALQRSSRRCCSIRCSRR